MIELCPIYRDHEKLIIGNKKQREKELSIHIEDATSSPEEGTSIGARRLTG